MGYALIYFISFLYSFSLFVKTERTPVSDVLFDVISRTPDKVLQVRYGDVEVDLGNMLSPLQTKFAPQVQWEYEPCYNYTLACVDPDAPLPQFDHWLVVDIAGDDIGRGTVLLDYFPPTPPPGEAHRYVFLLYRQLQGVPFDFECLPPTLLARVDFEIENFADNCNLGDPIAVNFCRVQTLNLNVL